MASYAKMLLPGGRLIISGFFETDADELILVAEENGLLHSGSLSRETWAALTFDKN